MKSVFLIIEKNVKSEQYEYYGGEMEPEYFMHSIYSNKKKSQDKCIELNKQYSSINLLEYKDEIFMEIDNKNLFEKKMDLIMEQAKECKDSLDIKYYYVVEKEILN